MRLRFLIALLAAGLRLNACLAHGSHDTGARLILKDHSAEAAIAIGNDGARHVLLKAGLSEEETRQALAFRGPSTLSRLPLTLAPQLLEITLDDKPVPAGDLKVISDGIETSFILSYPTAFSGKLKITARYLEGDESLQPGALFVMDEFKNVKATANLSHQTPTASIALPAFGTAPAAISPKPVELAEGGVAAHANEPSGKGGSLSAGRTLVPLFVIGAIAAGLLLFLLLRSRGR